MILRLLSLYYFSLECIFLYFLLLLFYVHSNKVPPLLAFLCIGGIANLFLYYSLRKKQISRIIPMLAGFISGGIAYFLGFNLFPSIFCTFFIIYRVNAFINDSSLWMEERKKLPVIFYCSSFIVFITAWITDYSYINWVYSILIIFTLLFSLGRFLQQAIVNNEIKNVNGLLLSLVIAAMLTGLCTLLLPFVKWICFTLFEFVVKFVGFVATPLFNFVETIHIKPKPKGPIEDFVINRDPTQLKQNDEFLIQHFPSWIWLVLVIVILVIVWLFLRRYKLQSAETNIEQSPVEIEYASSNLSKKQKKRFFKHSAPSEPIRKLIFQLQKYASKHNMGRQNHETIKEWFIRNNFPIPVQLLNDYDNVRYGNGTLIGNEKEYEDEIQKIKQEIKNKDIKKD